MDLFFRNFGPKYVRLKTIIEPTLPLLEDHDKSARDEARALLAEVYRWSGEAIRPTLKELKPAQVCPRLHLKHTLQMQCRCKKMLQPMVRSIPVDEAHFIQSDFSDRTMEIVCCSLNVV